MRLTVVGCAGSAPAPESTCSCYLVEATDFRLLLDLGPGSSGPLQRYVRPDAVDLVILSHGHSDHHADLTQLPRLREETTTQPLRVIGPSDMPDVLTSYPDVFTASVATEVPFDAGPMRLRLARVEHGECWATRVDDALCYTADSAPCTALDELAAGCRVLLAEASGSDADGPMSATPHRRGRRTPGRPIRVAAAHPHPPAPLAGPRPLLAEAAALADCPVILAHPGLRVAL